MEWIITVGLGALVGWIASVVFDVRSHLEAAVNVIVGVACAALGRWLLGDVFGRWALGDLSHIGIADGFSLAGIGWGALAGLALICAIRTVRDTP